MKIIIQEREGMKMEIHEVAERNENKKTVRGEWKRKYRYSKRGVVEIQGGGNESVYTGSRGEEA